MSKFVILKAKDLERDYLINRISVCAPGTISYGVCICLDNEADSLKGLVFCTFHNALCLSIVTLQVACYFVRVFPRDQVPRTQKLKSRLLRTYSIEGFLFYAA